MRSRERQNDPSDHHRDPSGGPSGENLDRIRQAGERLFEAGNDAISRTLSGNSLEFLNATQQEGGQ